MTHLGKNYDHCATSLGEMEAQAERRLVRLFLTERECFPRRPVASKGEPEGEHRGRRSVRRPVERERLALRSAPRPPATATAAAAAAPRPGLSSQRAGDVSPALLSQGTSVPLPARPRRAPSRGRPAQNKTAPGDWRFFFLLTLKRFIVQTASVCASVRLLHIIYETHTKSPG